MKTWLQELPQNEVAVIVNERAGIGIDGELLAAHVARLTEITGGCVCCSSQAELMTALRELSSGPAPPRRILIETSGAASPAGVVRGVTALRDKRPLRLDGVVTVIDIARARAALEFDLTVEQLGFADVVVLSHMDTMEAQASAAEVEQMRTELQRYAPAAVFAAAYRGTIGQSLMSLLEARAEVLAVPSLESGHSPIEAVALSSDGELDEDRFIHWVETAVADVEARILRVKGIVAIQGVDARVVLQGVSQAVEVELGRVWGSSERTSRVVILGLGLDAAALEAGFLRSAYKKAPPR